MCDILQIFKKAAVYIVVLCLVLFPLAYLGTPVRTYAADNGNRSDVVSTAQTAEETAAGLSESSSEAPEQKAKALPVTETADFSGIGKKEVVTAMVAPEIAAAKADAQQALIDTREEKDKAWADLKTKEKAEADARAEAAAEAAKQAADRNRNSSSSGGSSSGGSSSGSGSSSGHLVDLGKFKLTAYCPCYECSEGWGRHTSTGATARANHTIAVDPSVIPYGTKVKINGEIYTAEDEGGGVTGNHIDIFYDEHSDALNFGVEYREVYAVE